MEDNTTPGDGSALSLKDAMEMLSQGSESDAEGGDAAEDEQQPEAGEQDDDSEPVGDQDDGDDSEPVEEESETPDTFDIDGETMTLDDIRELKQSVEQREKNLLADYTRSKQKLHGEARQVREDYGNRVARLNQIVEQLAPILPSPPSPQMRREDPIGWQDAKATYDETVAMLDQISAAKNQAVEDHKRSIIKESIDYFTSGAYDPAWRDEGAFQDGMDALTDYGLASGLTESELGEIVDHRFLVLLDKARRFDEMQKKKPQAVQKARSAPKVVKPSGAGAAKKSQSQARGRMREKFMKSGSIDDAMSWLTSR